MTDERPALAVLGGSFGVRPQLVLLGPLVPWLAIDFGADHATLGLIGTATLLATAGGAVVAGRGIRRWGAAHTVSGMLALILIGAGARVVAPNVALLVAASVLVGFAIGVAS